MSANGGHDLTNAERRVAERALWRNGFAAAVIVHLLVFLLWWGEAELVSPFAAAGPAAGDSRAARGGMQTINIRVPPPRLLIRPRVPLVPPLTFDPVPVEELEDDQQQIETASILGDRPGVDAPGLPDPDGRGDGGNQELAGTWVLTVDLGPFWRGDATFVLEQDGTRISGTYSGLWGTRLKVRGTVEDGLVKFSFVSTRGVVVYEGTLEGTTLKGRCVYGQLNPGTFAGSHRS